MNLRSSTRSERSRGAAGRAFLVAVAVLAGVSSAVAASRTIGGIAEVQTGPRMNINVVVNLGSRQRDAVARAFLANPRDAVRFTSRGVLTIPFDALADPYKAIAALRGFPDDKLTDDGVVHVVTLDDETLGGIAGIYTGDVSNAGRIRRAGAVGEVSVTRNHEILVTIPAESIQMDSLARAVLKVPAGIRRMLRDGNFVINAEALKDPYRAAVLKHLFHQDILREDVVRHKVVLNIESLHRIALWYTGNADNWQAIKRASNKRNNDVTLRETISVPRSLLGSWAQYTEDDIAEETSTYPLTLTSRSRPGGISIGQQLLVPKPLLAKWTRLMADGEDAAQEAASWFVYDGTTNGPLTYRFDREGGYALYTLKRGEAIYSSVTVRFTGLLEAPDVLAASREILKRSGYRDARRLPANARIKIPISLLSPEWRPEGDPSRAAETAEETEVAQEKREIQQEEREAPRTRTRALDGITVILDAGHGGRDPGALGPGGLTENEIVYDIMCRVMRELETRTRARVLVTIEDKKTAHRPSESSTIRDNRDEILRTTPPYNNRNIVTSANLRWYLANAYVRSAVNSGASLDDIVFTSFHADALHPSVGGAMIYVPSAQHSTGRYVAKSEYRSYREVRQRPLVSFTTSERRRAHAMSESFARLLARELEKANVDVHDRKPIRGYIVRSARRRPWVPAVLKFNAAQTKLLVEVGNIKNTADAANMRSPAWRQRFAEGYVSALIARFGG